MADIKTAVLTVDTGGAITNIKEFKQHIEDLKGKLLGLEKGTEEYNTVAQELRQSQEKLNEVMDVAKGKGEVVAGSYDNLVATMRELKKEWRATGDEIERQKLGEKILEINNQLKELDASTGNYQRNVGDYSNAFEKAFEKVLQGVGNNNTAIGKLALMVKNLLPVIKAVNTTAVTGLSGIKKAIASTGIGLLVVAVGEIAAHWKDINEWIQKTIFNQTKYTDAVEQSKKEMELLKATIEAANSQLSYQMRLMQAQGAQQITIYNTQKSAIEGQMSSIYKQIRAHEEWLFLYEDSWSSLGRKERQAVEAHKNSLTTLNEEYKKLSGQLKEVENNIKIAEAEEKKHAEEIAEAAQFALLTREQQLRKQYETEKALLEKNGVDTTALYQKYLRDLAELRKTYGSKVSISSIVFNTSNQDYNRLRSEVEKALNDASLITMDMATKNYSVLESLMENHFTNGEISYKEYLENINLAIDYFMGNVDSNISSSFKTTLSTLEKDLSAQLENGEITVEEYINKLGGKLDIFVDTISYGLGNLSAEAKKNFKAIQESLKSQLKSGEISIEQYSEKINEFLNSLGNIGNNSFLVAKADLDKMQVYLEQSLNKGEITIEEYTSRVGDLFKGFISDIDITAFINDTSNIFRLFTQRDFAYFENELKSRLDKGEISVKEFSQTIKSNVDALVLGLGNTITVTSGDVFKKVVSELQTNLDEGKITVDEFVSGVNEQFNTLLSNVNLDLNLTSNAKAQFATLQAELKASLDEGKITYEEYLVSVKNAFSSLIGDVRNLVSSTARKSYADGLAQLNKSLEKGEITYTQFLEEYEKLTSKYNKEISAEELEIAKSTLQKELELNRERLIEGERDELNQAQITYNKRKDELDKYLREGKIKQKEYDKLIAEMDNELSAKQTEIHAKYDELRLKLDKKYLLDTQKITIKNAKDTANRAIAAIQNEFSNKKMKLDIEYEISNLIGGEFNLDEYLASGIESVKKDLPSRLGGVKGIFKDYLSFPDIFSFKDIEQNYERLKAYNDSILQATKEKNQAIIEENQKLLQSLPEGSQEALDAEMAISEARMAIQDAETENLIANIEAQETKEQEQAQRRDERFQMYAESLSTVGSMIDSFASLQEAQIRKEVEEGKISEEQAKKRFEDVKKMQIASAIVNMAGGVVSAIATAQQLGPIAGPIMAAINSAAVIAAGLVQIASIKRTQFGSSAGNVSTPDTNTVVNEFTPEYTQNITTDTELSELANAVNSKPLYVSVTDIENVQNTVSVREEESTY